MGSDMVEEERDEAEAVAAIVDGIEMPDWHVVANQRGRFRMELRMAVEAAREPLLKRIEELEFAVSAARSRANTAEERIEDLEQEVNEGAKEALALAAAKAEGRRQAFEEVLRVSTLIPSPRALSGYRPVTVEEFRCLVRALAKEGR